MDRGAWLATVHGLSKSQSKWLTSDREDGQKNTKDVFKDSLVGGSGNMKETSPKFLTLEIDRVVMSWKISTFA